MPEKQFAEQTGTNFTSLCLWRISCRLAQPIFSSFFFCFNVWRRNFAQLTSSESPTKYKGNVQKRWGREAFGENDFLWNS